LVWAYDVYYMSKEANQSKDKFSPLGNCLRKMREKRQESLAEVSGAVEIDVEALVDIEQGKCCPSEDILLLMISHFGAKEDEATKLWELAGYDQHKVPASNMVNDENGQAKPMVMVLPADARIVYTDMVHVMVNNYGVVMNFMQGAGPGSQPLAVARVGMSREHAQSVLEVLQQTLAQADTPSQTKALPAPKAKSKKPKDKNES
jgi:DNA-binding XRE family transcriptional regulator